MRRFALLVLAPALLTAAPGGGVRARLAWLTPGARTGAHQLRVEPFVPVGAWYPATDTPGPGSPGVAVSPAAREVWRRELAALRAAGFNTIRTPVDWATSEPQHGVYRFDRLVDLLSAAEEAGLRVIVQVEARTAPAWLTTRYPDSLVVTSQARKGSSAGGYCMDHPGARADLAAFIGAASAAAAPSPAFYAVDVWRNPGVSSSSAAEFCYCRYTQDRFREALRRKYQTLPALSTAWKRSFSDWSQVHVPPPGSASADVVDWQQFVSVKLAEDLKFRADASAPRGPRAVTSHSDDRPGRGIDDWLMSAAVDHYGASLLARAARPARALASLDVLRSADRGRSWWLGGLSAGLAANEKSQGGGRETLRLWAWAAISRGAGALTFGLLTGNPGAPAEPAGSLGRSQAGAEMAGVVSRNASLFAGLRPHSARIAILGDARGRTDAIVNAYEALFDVNIQVDFLHPDELLAGGSARYDVLYAVTSDRGSPAVNAVLRAFVTAGGTLILERAAGAAADALERTFDGSARAWVEDNGPRPGNPALPGSQQSAARGRVSALRVATVGAGRVLLVPPAGMTPVQMRGAREQLQRLVAAVGISPEIGLDAPGALVEARFLESADAILLVAMNYGSVTRKVTLTFAPDVPEAIWQNMETGAAVNFRQGPNGATYTRTFEPRDAMVLVRGKRLR